MQAGQELLKFAKRFSDVVSRERCLQHLGDSPRLCDLQDFFFPQMMEEAFAGGRWCVEALLSGRARSSQHPSGYFPCLPSRVA